MRRWLRTRVDWGRLVSYLISWRGKAKEMEILLQVMRSQPKLVVRKRKQLR
jgi:hypothetical protein